MAIWGIFFSETGDRLINALRADIVDAKGELSVVRGQRVSAENQLADQQKEIFSNQASLLESSVQLALLEQQKIQVFRELEVSNLALKDEKMKASIMKASLDVTIPTRKRLTCSSTLSHAERMSTIISLMGILSNYRYERFLIETSSNDDKTWSDTLHRFKQWSSSSNRDNTYIKSADSRVETDMETQSEFNGYAEETRRYMRNKIIPAGKKLEIETHFPFRESSKNYQNIEKYNPWTSISNTISRDELAQIDPSYKKWISNLENIFQDEKFSLDFDFPIETPSDLSRSDIMLIGSRMESWLYASDRIIEKSKPVCG
ncbi:hypothetical protein [Sphingopyxis sp. BE259]|uniref:hypothetical protein n=1 Tax=Sphingopyxis sp. BE259 TaxID=2817723 RepID=UPI00285EE344|nr:hypothetical protein [Sphingopyxis sp. BE259]MDR6832696.1 hypothetical protein [Sphingopyxis sp. BE122]MDR7228439.1 hypothetical protein [Sphingopyxis sp. BE259]